MIIFWAFTKQRNLWFKNVGVIFLELDFLNELYWLAFVPMSNKHNHGIQLKSYIYQPVNHDLCTNTYRLPSVSRFLCIKQLFHQHCRLLCSILIILEENYTSFELFSFSFVDILHIYLACKYYLLPMEYPRQFCHLKFRSLTNGAFANAISLSEFGSKQYCVAYPYWYFDICTHCRVCRSIVTYLQCVC